MTHSWIYTKDKYLGYLSFSCWWIESKSVVDCPTLLSSLLRSSLFFTYGLTSHIFYGLTSHIFWTYQLPPTPSILFQRLLEEYLRSDTQNVAFIVSIGLSWTMSPAVKGSPVVCTRYLDISLAPRKTIVCSLCKDSSSVFLILNVMYNWLYF